MRCGTGRSWNRHTAFRPGSMQAARALTRPKRVVTDQNRPCGCTLHWAPYRDAQVFHGRQIAARQLWIEQCRAQRRPRQQPKNIARFRQRTNNAAGCFWRTTEIMAFVGVSDLNLTRTRDRSGAMVLRQSGLQQKLWTKMIRNFLPEPSRIDHQAPEPAAGQRLHRPPHR